VRGPRRLTRRDDEASSNITVEVSEALDPTTLEAPDGQYSNGELFKFNKNKRKWQ
jgi:hypothetical protein